MEKTEILKKAETIIRKLTIMKIIQKNKVHIHDVNKLIEYFEANNWE